MTATQIMHVPYKASPVAALSAASGEVDLSFQIIASVLPLIKSAKLKALGVTFARRTILLPDVPPIAETVPGYDCGLFQGLLAPARTPPAVLARLRSEIIKAMNTATLREQLTNNGYEQVESSPQAFATFISDYVDKMREAIKISGARPDD